jgi:hypothetical protein
METAVAIESRGTIASVFSRNNVITRSAQSDVFSMGARSPALFMKVLLRPRMGMLSGVIEPRSLWRCVQLRLGFSALRVPDITPICAASLRTLMYNAG